MVMTPCPLPLAPFFMAAFRFFSQLPCSGATLAFAQADDRMIYASVVDKDGEPVLDLGAKDFVVREDGQPREILRVARDTDPLQIALLVDNSDRMRNQPVGSAPSPRERSSTRRAKAYRLRSLRSPSARRSSWATPPIVRALRKAIDNLFALPSRQLPARRHRGNLARLVETDDVAVGHRGHHRLRCRSTATGNTQKCCDSFARAAPRFTS